MGSRLIFSAKSGAFTADFHPKIQKPANDSYFHPKIFGGTPRTGNLDFRTGKLYTSGPYKKIKKAVDGQKEEVEFFIKSIRERLLSLNPFELILRKQRRLFGGRRTFQTSIQRQMQSVEKLLLRIEQRPWDAISRVVIGVCIPGIFRFIFRADGSPLALVLFLLGMIGTLRIVPAILRRLLPFSAEAQADWAGRRMLAKRYDSYQWQKLFWIGLGVAFDAALSAQYYNSSIVLASVCVIPGFVGLVVWRIRRMTDKSIKALSSNRAANKSSHIELE